MYADALRSEFRLDSSWPMDVSGIMRRSSGTINRPRTAECASWTSEGRTSRRGFSWTRAQFRGGWLRRESETLAGWGEFIVCLRLTPGPPNWPFLKRLDSVGRRRVLEEVAIGLLGWTPDGGGYEYRDWVEIPWPGYSWQDRLRRLQAVTSGLLTEVRTVRSELRGVSYDGRPVTFEEALAVLHRPDQESSLPRFSVDESVPSAEGRLLTDELFEAVTTTAWDEAVKVMGEQDAVPELPGWPTGASPRGFAWIVRQYIRDVARALARVEHSRIIDGPPTSDQRQCLPAALAHRPVIQVPQEVADLVASPGPSAESLPHSVHRPDGPGDRRTWTFWWGGTPYSLTELRWKLLMHSGTARPVNPRAKSTPRTSTERYTGNDPRTGGISESCTDWSGI